MDRRKFLAGLFGIAGTAALVGVAARPADATPLARAMDLPEFELPESVDADGGFTADGTPVEQAQYRGRRRGPPPRRGYYRRPPRRRRSRVVCRNYRVRGGRVVRRCQRVYF